MTTFRAFSWLIWTSSLLAVMSYCIAESRVGMAILGLAACGASAALMRGGVPRSLPRISINLMVMAATANVVMRVIAAHRPEIADMVDFLVYILLIKMFDRGRGRDEAQLLGLSVFVVIGAVLESNSFVLGLTLMAYMPLAIIAAITYQIYAGVRRAGERRAEIARLSGSTDEAGLSGSMRVVESRRGGRELLATILAALVLSGVMTTIGFVVMPRTLNQQTLGALGEVRSGAETEFRDRIDLGQGGPISTSEEPVMDLVLKDDEGNPITDRRDPVYLRGAVLDVYDSDTREWRNSKLLNGKTPDLKRAFGPGEAISLGAGADPGKNRLVQEITVRNAPPNASPLFAMWRPWRVKIDDGRVTVFRGEWAPQRERGMSGRYSYTVESDATYLGGDESEEPPPMDVPARVREFAFDRAREAGISGDPAEREPSQTRRLVTQVMNHLRDRYGYDLTQTATPDGKDPIEMFLWETKKGHCEYFAAAMVASLRALGVPARVVTGYAAGEFNSLSGVYVVRKADAHAWVEAKIRPDRWETFDPTPAGSLNSTQRSTRGVLAWLRQAYEAMEFRWINNVVAFDQSRKIDLGQAALDHRARMLGLSRAISRLGNAIGERIPGFSAVKELSGTLAFGLEVFVGLAFAAIIGGGAWFVVRRTQKSFIGTGGSRPPALGKDPASKLYRRLLLSLDRAGFAKPEGRPPLLHAAMVGRRDARAGELAEQLTKRFYQARFGRKAPDAQELANDGRLLAELERALAKIGAAEAPKA